MSQLGQKRRFGRQPTTSGLPRSTDIVRPARLVRFVPKPEIRGSILFDQRVGGDEQSLRYIDAKSFCGFEIDREYVFGGCLYRKIGGLGAA
jgi:hypothetical protein